MTSTKIVFISLFIGTCIFLSIVTSSFLKKDNFSQSTAKASLPPVTEAEEELQDQPLYHTLIEGQLLPGDTLGKSLARAEEISPGVRQAIVSYLANCLDLKRLKPSDNYRIYLDEHGELLRCEYESGPLDHYSVKKIDDNFESSKDNINLEVKVSMAQGIIDSSLFEAFQQQDINPSAVYAFADIFSSKFDFNTETQENDSFQMVYEKYYKNDEFIGIGKILYGRYQQDNGNVMEAYLYGSDKVVESYFDSEGNDLGTSFIKSPLPMGRLTSKFTMRRKHPILGVVRPHLGVDLAAPVGTPIMAAAEGKVAFIGTKGGFGRQIILTHPNGYKTHYGHLSRFLKGLKKGSFVKQKQTIGFVGSSGMSTGPHLDYRLEKNGQFMNPFSVKFKPRLSLDGEELAVFNNKIKNLARLIETTTGPDTLYVRQLIITPEDKLSIL